MSLLRNLGNNPLSAIFGGGNDRMLLLMLAALIYMEGGDMTLAIALLYIAM
jgi:hypothetical protein